LLVLEGPSPPELWECGNLGFARFPRDCGKGGKPLFGFPCFPQSRHFHSSPFSLSLFSLGRGCSGGYGRGGSSASQLRILRRSAALATTTLRAHSVSLIALAIRSSFLKLTSFFRYPAACSSDFSFSYGVA